MMMEFGWDFERDGEFNPLGDEVGLVQLVPASCSQLKTAF